MGNIEFSKEGEAILKNKALADYISYRMANLNPEEIRIGRIEVKLKNGMTLYLRFGPSRSTTSLSSAHA